MERKRGLFEHRHKPKPLDKEGRKKQVNRQLKTGREPALPAPSAGAVRQRLHPCTLICVLSPVQVVLVQQSHREEGYLVQTK